MKARHLDRRRVRELIQQVRPLDDIGDRVAAIGTLLVGAPYRFNPLDGAPSVPEELALALDGFDCVTYVEYALALAGSTTADEFVDNVRKIRYAGGVVDWKTRNHYMTDWIRNNVRSGFVQDRTGGPGLVERQRDLGGVPGLRSRRVRVRSIRKREFVRRLSGIATGDLAFFASTRPNLDVFHCGILVVDTGGKVGLLHAARSRGRVVTQSLCSFLAANRMSGVMPVRPMAG